MDAKKTFLICFVILLTGGAATLLIFSTEPSAKRSGATKETAMLVNTTTVDYGSYNPTIRVMGTVVPSQDINLSPRVNGEVIERSPAFTPGGYVEKGDMLLQIDPADYENALKQRQSELSEVKADLNIEMGRQQAAQREYEMYGDTLSEENKALVLRKPQLDAVRARMEAAQAAVEQAKLDLQRTSIRAPFNAHILSRNANLGSQVAAGENLGRLVGLDTYWVEATVPLSNLRWLSFPNDGGEGSDVRIKNRTAWEEGTSRQGKLYQMIGALEDRTRMARVLISVPDPLAYQTENADVPPLMIGSFVEANIQGKKLNDVFRLSRDHIREDQTVWVMADGKLRIQDVNIMFQDAEYAYINDGLNKQDRIVTTNLSTVVDGAQLRVESPEEQE